MCQARGWLYNNILSLPSRHLELFSLPLRPFWRPQATDTKIQWYQDSIKLKVFIGYLCLVPNVMLVLFRYFITHYPSFQQTWTWDKKGSENNIWANTIESFGNQAPSGCYCLKILSARKAILYFMEEIKSLQTSLPPFGPQLQSCFSGFLCGSNWLWILSIYF